MTADVRPLPRELASEAAELLARAFSVSPAYDALLGHLAPAAKARALLRVKRGFVEASIRYQAPFGLFQNGALVACMLVMEPGQYPMSLVAQAVYSAGGALTGPRAIVKLLRMQSHISARHIEEPHAYLSVLGVDPLHQRRGHGRALLRHLNDYVDTHGIAAYLETDTTDNVRLYESVGYEVMTDEIVKGLDLRYFTMRRAKR